MDVKLQELLIQYRSLVILSSIQKEIKIKPKWLKRIRRDITNYLDTEFTFLEIHKILKSVEKDSFGFYVKPRKAEKLVDNENKLIYQEVEVGINYMGGKTYKSIKDTGFDEIMVEKNTNIRVSKQIKPTEIISISNSEILYKIKKMNKKVYKYIFGLIVDELYTRVDRQIKENYLKNNLRKFLASYGIFEDKYDLEILKHL